MYTLDTNAIIYYLKDDPDAVEILREILEKNTPLYISALTEIELFGFPDLTSREANRIEELLNSVSVIPVDSRVARIAGSLRREHRLKISDSAIAATALFTGTTVLTRNIRDFKRVPYLSVGRI